MAKNLHILVVDDEEDLRELLSFMISTEVNCEIVEGSTGQQAIEAIQTQRPDIIFCDYNMPNGNGGDVFKFMLENDIKVPFILVSSDRPEDYPIFKDQDFVYSLTKPFDDNDLKQILQKVQAPENDSIWIPIRIDIIKKFDFLYNDVYVQLSEDKFVKLIHKDVKVNEIDFDKYTVKGIQNLYIKKEDVDDFIQCFSKNVLSQRIEEFVSIEKSFDLLKSSFGIIKSISDSMGWGENIKKLANESIELILNDLSKQSLGNPDFKNVLDKILSPESTDFADHSASLVYLTTGLAQQAGWPSKITTYKLTMAAFLHDMTLSDMQILNELDYSLALAQGSSAGVMEDLIQFQEHPIAGSEVARHWPLAHPDVDLIISEHHERPDGSGFPFAKAANDISPLASLFIVAEDLFFAYKIAALQGSPFDLKNYISERKDYFNKGHFKTILDSLSQSLSSQ